MNWLHYLAEANLYLAVFYLAYRLLLAKETYNQLNRAYLLLSCVAAFTLPVLQVGALKPAQVVTFAQRFSSLAMAPVQQNELVTFVPVAVVEHHLTWQDYLIYVYALGCVVLLVALFIKLMVLIRMIWTAKHERVHNYKLIYLSNSDVAFSFFNYLFIGTDAIGEKTIIRHELVHINQKHSLDILFIELLKVINWFNPFIYLLQNSLKTIHEYIADEQTAAHENDTVGYAAFLVNNAYGAGGSSITHSFFNYSLLKKRIIMLNQKRSGNSARLKYLIAAPICAGLLCASTLAFSKDYGWIDLDPAKVIVTSIMPPPAIDTTKKAQHGKVKFPPPPPPMVVNDHYLGFAHYLNKVLRYDPKKGKDAVALVSFSITTDHHLADAKIVKSAGKLLDASVLQVFDQYRFPINDQPGDNYIARVYFFNHNYNVFRNNQQPNSYKLEVLANIWSNTYRATAKGFEFDLHKTMVMNNGKRQWHTESVTIYGKNGEVENFKPATADANMLKEKYGFVWPEAAVRFPAPADQVKLPPPTGAPSAQAKIAMPHDSLMVLLDQISTELSQNIHYPNIARSNNITGRVLVQVNVADNGDINYVKVIRNISNSLAQEVFRVAKKSQRLKKLPGNWIIPVSFILDDTALTNISNVPDTAPVSETAQNTFIYNPDNLVASIDDAKMLAGPIIRGYTK